MKKKLQRLGSCSYIDHAHDHTNVTLWGLLNGRILKRRVTVTLGDEDYDDANSIDGHSKWAEVDGLGNFSISGRIDHNEKLVTVGGGGCHNNRQVAYAIKRLEKQYPDHDILVDGSPMRQWEAINR